MAGDDLPEAVPHDVPVALVTGAAQGIGAAIAVELARTGHDLVVSSMQPSRLDPVCAAIRATGRRAVAIALDLREMR